MDEKAVSAIYRVRTGGDPSHPYYNPELRRRILALNYVPTEPAFERRPEKLDAIRTVVDTYLSANGLPSYSGGFGLRAIDDGAINRIICDDLLRIFDSGIINGFCVETVEIVPESPPRPGFAVVRVSGVSVKTLDELRVSSSGV